MGAVAVKRLRAAVAALPGIEGLKFPPTIEASEVNEAMVARLQRWSVPSLVFLDPWGYKGLTLHLINAALAKRFTDVIFFFNYNRVNAAITNEFMEEALPPGIAGAGGLFHTSERR